MNILLPRFTTTQAMDQYATILENVRAGAAPHQLPRLSLGGAAPNPTGGRAATDEDLRRWRKQAIDDMTGYLPTGAKESRDLYAARLGRVLVETIDPSPADAAHDGVWSFLSLQLFPDYVMHRWPLNADGVLPRDRWIGAQDGRDRNFLKSCWRRWRVFGDLTERRPVPLGEDEYVALLERSALARNQRVLRLAAEQILAAPEGLARTTFAREFMKRITYQTGALSLDLLNDEELGALVSAAAADVLAELLPRRAQG